MRIASVMAPNINAPQNTTHNCPPMRPALELEEGHLQHSRRHQRDGGRIDVRSQIDAEEGDHWQQIDNLLHDEAP